MPTGGLGRPGVGQRQHGHDQRPASRGGGAPGRRGGEQRGQHGPRTTTARSAHWPARPRSPGTVIGHAPGAAGRGGPAGAARRRGCPGRARRRPGSRARRAASSTPLALEAAHPPGQVGDPGSVPSTTAGRDVRRAACRRPAPAARARTSVAVDGRHRLGQHRRQHDHDGAGGRRRAAAGSAAQVARRRPAAAGRAGLAGGAGGGARRRSRTCSPPRPDHPQRTRSPRRTWCSAIAAAARTVTSRLLAAPSTPPERAVVGQRVDHEQHAGVLLGAGADDVQRVGAQRDPPVDPAQPVPGVERPDAGELGAVARPRGSGARRPARAAAAPRRASRTAPRTGSTSQPAGRPGATGPHR